MGFLKKIKAKLEDFLQFEEEWKACYRLYYIGNMRVKYGHTGFDSLELLLH